jgi:hypothetical protein
LKFLGAGITVSLPFLLLMWTLGMIGLNGTVIIGVYLLLILLVAYFYPFLIGNMVHKKRFMAFFDLKEAVNSLKNVGYKRYTLYLLFWVLLTFIPVGIFVGITKLSTFNLDSTIILSLLGIPVLLLLEVYFAFVGGRFIGLIMRKSLENE